MKFDIVFFEKSVKIIEVSLKPDNNKLLYIKTNEHF